MPGRHVDIGVVTDEVSRNLEEAFDISSEWGISRFELREGSEARFPGFTDHEVAFVDSQIRTGNRITAVSPGILKGHIQNKSSLRREMESTLPRAIELGVRFGCPLLIVFGFERASDETVGLRSEVMRAFERVAQEAEEAGMTVAIENEPNFWVDRPRDTAEMLKEIGHPALKANWDPANSHWGGYVPDYDDFLTLRPFIANVHVKDHLPSDAEAPWRPVGRGETPWMEFLPWLVRETELNHVTLETHCQPLAESSRESLVWLRKTLAEMGGTS